MLSDETLAGPLETKADTPYLHLVPKGYYANLEFRARMIRLGSSSREAAENLWIMCSRDILFYVNTFVWTHDPRKKPTELPFITYDYQDEAILEIVRCIEEGEDLPIEKSRDMGATWMVLVAFEWFWHFRSFNNFLVVSRNQGLVDSSGSPDTLFWKLDFLLEKQPGWLKPPVSRILLHIQNLETGSVIDGESTTGDVARGGRYTSILLDEFASVPDGQKVLSASRDATRSRIINSTPKGRGNAFYRFVAKAANKLTLHWSLHPEKAKGLSCDAEGKPTSPWYEREKLRASHPMEIAQELDIDYLTSDYVFFSVPTLERLKTEDCRIPFFCGDIEFNMQTLQPMADAFIDRERGPLNLWIFPKQDGNIPAGNYVLGVDISVGTGSSNSVISIGDKNTGQKVAEYVNAHLKPHELARVAVALARWFRSAKGPAFMVWESNGPGQIFGDMVIESKFRNFHYREDRTSILRKRSLKPGWFSTKESKMSLLGEYRRALSDGEFIQRSREALDEAESYIFTANGNVRHSSSVESSDPTDTGDNHGDRVIADALMWLGAKSVTPAIPDDRKPASNSFGARFLSRRKAERKAGREELYAV